MADHWTKKALLDAVKRDDVEFIKKAIELGYLTKKTINDLFIEKFGPNGRYEAKTTLLGNTTSLEMTKCLVEAGADVNQVCERPIVHHSEGYQTVKCTRLIWCAIEELGKNHPEQADLFKFLIDSGAKVDERALFSLVSKPEEFHDLIDYVLKNNAREEGNPAISDKALIDYAVRKGVGQFANLSRSLSILYLLLDNGVSVESKYIDQALAGLTAELRFNPDDTKKFKKESKRLIREHARSELKSKIMLKLRALADKFKSSDKKEEKEAE